MTNRGRSKRQPRLDNQRRPLFNYYSSKSEPPVQQTVQRAGRRLDGLGRRLVDITLVVSLACLLIYSLILKPPAKLNSSSSVYRPIGDYQTYINERLKALKYRNKITFDDAGLLGSLQSRFPEIDSLDSRLPLLGQQPRINLIISEPAFYLVESGRRYIVDRAGIVVGQKSEFNHMAKLPSINDRSRFKTQTGQSAFSSSGVYFINQLSAQLGKAKLEVDSIELPARAQQLNLRVVGQAYYVKFYLSGDPLVQIGQYLAARQHFKRSHIQPRQYLDVRVPGKLYYR